MAAVQELQTALSLRPGWGAAHYNLAMEYWQLRRYDRALEQARMAEQAGVPQARAAARTLSAYLSSRITP